jgi:hypothetical protein
MDAYLNLLSAERKQYLRDLANDEWVDRVDEITKRDDSKFQALSAAMYEERCRFLATTESDIELHYFVDHWNWGGGVEAMRAVAEHPHCDAATALLIYWRADPQYYLKFHARDAVPDYNRGGYDLVLAIEARYLSDCYSRGGEVGYVPSEDMRIAEPVPGDRTIPVLLLQGVRRTTVSEVSGLVGSRKGY